MAIDLDKEQGRKDYLTSKLDDLLDGINDSYGKVLLDELITRLDSTIKDFNEEIQSLMAGLKDNTVRKEELMKRIIIEEKEGPAPDSESNGESDEKVEPAAEMSEWEKRLEELSKKE